MLIEVSFIVYLLIGAIFVLIGPIKRMISEETTKARGHPIANAIMGRQEVPTAKILAFQLTLTVVAIVIWPVALWSVMKSNAEERRELEQWQQTKRLGLEYTGMGGAGTIRCNDCGFHQGIVSFLHGETESGNFSAETGVQCLSCGRFTSRKNPNDSDSNRHTCECGGILSRDHILFCPNCRSNNMRYDLEMIT